MIAHGEVVYAAGSKINSLLTLSNMLMCTLDDAVLVAVDAVEVHCCVVMMQGKFVSFKHSINFKRVQGDLIYGSSSAILDGCVVMN